MTVRTGTDRKPRARSLFIVQSRAVGEGSPHFSPPGPWHDAAFAETLADAEELAMRLRNTVQFSETRIIADIKRAEEIRDRLARIEDMDPKSNWPSRDV